MLRFFLLITIAILRCLFITGLFCQSAINIKPNKFVLATDSPVAPEQEDGVNMKYFLVERNDGTFEVEDLIHSEIQTRASETDLTYHFYSKSDQSRGTVLRSNQISLLRNTEFSASKETLFIIHGWVSNSEGELNYKVREAILPKNDVNVFVVDWNPVASENYITAKNGVVNVGVFIGNFIRSLVSTYNLDLNKVACVGHSLGAHVCGNAGATLNGRLHHIVGLDPANPLFSVSNTDNRLDPTDAQFVQIIHTNGGLLGFSASIGHADYFPNGGRSQPGCGLDIGGGCAHSRAYAYYAEAISSSNNSFNSRLCSSYNDYSRGRCTSNAASVMGGFGVDTRARGDYYLDTNGNSKYARG